MEKCYCGNTQLDNYSEMYYICRKCKTLVSKFSFKDAIYHVENEKSDLYGKNYWEEVMVKESGVKNIDELIDLYMPERAIYWLKTCLKYMKLGSVVADVGCGLGQFSYMLKYAGFQQAAYELSPQVCKRIEQKLGLKTVCGELCCNTEMYETIVAMDVFEHLLNPDKFLEDCVERLESNGILVMQMPCYDPQLDYEEMLVRKPRFKHLLVEEQHVFLYSRESICNLLKSHGFKHIGFEPAFFGDDYDMFLFASKEPLQTNTEQEIDEYLNTVPSGRLVKAMIKLFDEKKELKSRYQDADNDRRIRLEQNKELEQLLQESEADRASRLEQINELTRMLQESEADRISRLEQINELTRMLQESEADRASGLGQINELKGMLQESEADRISRLEQINELKGMLQESEADRASRLEQINELKGMLQESEVDRASRLEQINELTRMLQESEADRASRLEQIDELTRMLQESEADRASRLEQINELTSRM